MKRAWLRRTRPIRASTRRPDVAALDALCREVVMLRDRATCQRCGSKARIQWCHLRSRRYHSTRWVLENSLMLCAGCHLWQHGNPLAFSAWFNERPEWGSRVVSISVAAACNAGRDKGAIKLYIESERRRLLRERGEAV